MCYEGTILQRINRKMTHVIRELCYNGTILRSFSYSSFEKFRDKIIWEPQHDHLCAITLVLKDLEPYRPNLGLELIGPDKERLST